MAIIDRDTAVTAADLEALTGLAPSPAPRQTDERVAWSAPVRVLLAVVLVAAGAIHLAMVPQHAAEWLPAGIAFAVAAWIQIGLAVALMARPSGAVVRLIGLSNAAFVAAWVFTRVAGWPLGPEAGVAEAATFVDVTCAALEAAAVVVGYELLARPQLAARLSQRSLAVLSVVPVAVLVLATAAVSSPSASSHAHGNGAAHEQASGVAHVDGHDHGAGAGPAMAGADPATAGAHGHDAAVPVDDKGLSLIMNGAGEGGGHVHSNEVVPVDAATQRQLDQQLAQTRPFIEKYPTVKDAEAAGYRRNGPYSPALGTHYAAAGQPFVNLGPTMTDEALAHPMLIYDGVEPDSKLAGFMYMIFSLDTQNPPEGFAGPNDHWHFHTDVCIKVRPDGGIDSPLGADASATKALCDQHGGILVANTGYMLHVWPVPGYESPQGMFSNLNSKLTCPNGTYYVVPQEEIGTKANVCKDVAA